MLLFRSSSQVVVKSVGIVANSTPRHQHDWPQNVLCSGCINHRFCAHGEHGSYLVGFKPYLNWRCEPVVAEGVSSITLEPPTSPYFRSGIERNVPLSS